MKKLTIMLCCGAGMSSGFLAQKTRQAAKKQGIEAKVDARSESAVEQYAEDIDVLLIGPHCAASYKNLSEICRENHISIAMIPSDIYSNLDGNGILSLAYNVYGKEHIS